jgi:hypothetical protein
LAIIGKLSLQKIVMLVFCVGDVVFGGSGGGIDLGSVVNVANIAVVAVENG